MVLIFPGLGNNFGTVMFIRDLRFYRGIPNLLKNGNLKFLSFLSKWNNDIWFAQPYGINPENVISLKLVDQKLFHFRFQVFLS